MSRSRRALRVPDRLAFSVVVSLAAGGCTQNSGTDASDVATEIATTDVAGETGVDAIDIVDIISTDDANDGAPCDTQPFSNGSFECMRMPGSDAGSCTPAYTCSANSCGAGCVGCAFDPGTFEYGFHCLADRDGGAAACPGIVCTAAECPAGCHSCRSTSFCIPDRTADVPVTACTPSSICEGDPDGCQPGCIQVG